MAYAQNYRECYYRSPLSFIDLYTEDDVSFPKVASLVNASLRATSLCLGRNKIHLID